MNKLCKFGCGSEKKLHVHHIDYDKQNSSIYNLITVCNSCNSKANFNREYWIKYYSKLTYAYCN